MQRVSSVVNHFVSVVFVSTLIFAQTAAATENSRRVRLDAPPTKNSAPKEDLRVAPDGCDGVTPDLMLHHYLMNEVHKSLDANTQAYEKLKTPAEIAAYQKRMKRFFVEQLGGFPERTPLNAKVVGRLQRDGYAIEKIIYESRPQFYVTALLYLPDEKACGIEPPYPGVLVPCGHSVNGKAREEYQRASVLLAKNGCVALCYDPIEQGERMQLLDKNGKPRVASTVGHNAVNVGCMLLGENAATYRIWDGMRGIDYLQSRPEVDPERIGCTGNSGGGTLTSFIMALDERVVCAAPCCYLTSFRRLLDTIGPQDAEQNIFGQVAFGMDHGEYVIARAPRPTLMCTATRDFFDIGGVWDSFRRAKRIYTLLNFPECVDLVETDEEHGFSKQLREGSTRWMRRWLLKIDDAVTEPNFPILSDQEAQVSKKGQVVYIDAARTTYDINAEKDAKLVESRKKIWQGDKQAALDAVRKTTGIRRPSELPKLECKNVGRIDRDGYHIDKLVLAVEPGLWLTALAFVPDAAATEKDAYLCVNAAGKATDAAPEGPIEKLVKQGRTVLALDPRGAGIPVGKSKTYVAEMGPLWTECTLAYLLGTSLTAMQAEDITAAATFLSGYESPQTPRKVHLVARGRIGVAALHAAALAPELFASLTLDRCLDSWADVVRTPLAKQPYPTLVFAALKTYDLPDLRASLPPGKLKLLEPLNAKGETIRNP